MTKKTHKVIVIGLPKTGTSTLAVMLRMLGYDVTGPEIHYEFGDKTYLDNKFLDYDGFQDYPWCFEWERYAQFETVKFIILHRDFESWWQSFYESYGNKKNNYLSFSYMQILKLESNKDQFFDYFRAYYKKAELLSKKQPENVLNIEIKIFEWDELCDFLGEKIPKGIFGKTVKKPHANRQNAKTKNTTGFKLQKKIKAVLLGVLGQRNYLKLIIFFRKNNLV